MNLLQATVLLFTGYILLGLGHAQTTQVTLVHAHPHYHAQGGNRYLVHSHIHQHPRAPFVVTNLMLMRFSIGGCAKGKYICDFNPFSMSFRLNVTCINWSQRCDGTRNCAFGDDETNCPASTTASTTVTGATTTVPTTTTGTTPVPACAPGSLVCSDKSCAKPCDGTKQCSDNIDEASCLCKTVNETICKLAATNASGCAKLCDGKQECLANEDEASCACNSTTIHCALSSPPRTGCANRCDGIPQCVNGTDESIELCAGRCTATQTWCVLKTNLTYGCVERCNGVQECNGTSEEDVKYCQCKGNETACSLAKGGIGCAALCDKKNDCVNATDELTSMCKCADSELSCIDKTDKPICLAPCTFVATTKKGADSSKCKAHEDIRCGCPAGEGRCADATCKAVDVACP